MPYLKQNDRCMKCEHLGKVIMKMKIIFIRTGSIQKGHSSVKRAKSGVVEEWNLTHNFSCDAQVLLDACFFDVQ